jgi:hypothetical protein
MDSCIKHYKMILRTIYDNTPIVPQTSKSADGQPVTSLTSNYMCLQCPTTVSDEDQLKHGNKKNHRFCMQGCVSLLELKRWLIGPSQMSIRGMVRCTARYVTTSCGIPL